MKLTLVEKMIIAAICAVVVVLVYNLTARPHKTTFREIKVPPGFSVAGFHKSNYVVGTYHGAPAVYDVMHNEVRVVQPSTTGTLVLEKTEGGA